jgi:hypothetical protein
MFEDGRVGRNERRGGECMLRLHSDSKEKNTNAGTQGTEARTLSGVGFVVNHL